MAETAQIINFADFRPTTAAAPSVQADVKIVPGEPPPVEGLGPVEFDDLYPSDEQTLIRKVRQMLLENEARCRAARDEDGMERDDAISRLKVDLASLFALRGLSSGLEIVIVALYHGLRNKHAIALSLDEYNEVLAVIRGIAGAPQIPVEGALDYVEKLHDVGLNTDPREADALYELIND